MIRKCGASDINLIFQIINDAASAYKGVIPQDCWSEPYMSSDYLLREIASGVRFWGCETGGQLAGVMGIQSVRDVILIRHAYVLTDYQGKGIGSRLLKFLCKRIPEIATTAESGLVIKKQNNLKVLVGTWADASWAIAFYEKHGFKLIPKKDKDLLLQEYWSIPRRQIITSVVLELLEPTN